MFKPRRGRWHVSPRGWFIALCAGVALFYFIGQGRVPPLAAGDAAALAVERMERAIAIVRDARVRAGVALDGQADPNRTGFIGAEWSALTTTYGEPATKRTATHPLWAGVIAHWLEQAGVGPGDVVLASFSGSFPALNTAVWVAADVVGAELVAVSSVGASMWGANIPQWSWPDMEKALWEAGAISGRSAAVSLGGEGDRGPMLEPQGVELALEAARRSGLPLLQPQSLAEAVEQRIALYEKHLNGRTPAVYVNVGGAQASLGICLDAHRLPPGLSTVPLPCAGGTRGVMSVMTLQHVPVVNLLNIKELALRAGIPLDGIFTIDESNAAPKSVYGGGGP